MFVVLRGLGWARSQHFRRESSIQARCCIGTKVRETASRAMHRQMTVADQESNEQNENSIERFW